MPKHIVNEGRVVGYAAYETYVKQVLSEDPTALPATEKEWLNSSIAYGAAMLLRVGRDTIEGPHYRDIAFPRNTSLTAANTIFGEFFVGRGKANMETTCNPSNGTTNWCSEVTDYGFLLQTSATPQPNGLLGPDIVANPMDAPNTLNTTTRNLKEWPDILPPDNSDDRVFKTEMKEYAKIVDGLVIHPGTWDNASLPGSKLQDPNFKTDFPSYEENQYPRLRLMLADKIETEFYILLTGFTTKTIIHGVTHTKSTGMLTDPHFPSPQDGAYLGPGEWPWSAKVIFSTPNGYINYMIVDNYRRQMRPGNAVTQYLPGNSSDGFINPDPLYDASNPALLPANRSSIESQVTLDQRLKTNPQIDMDMTNPQDYYARLDGQAGSLTSGEALLAAQSKLRLNVTGFTQMRDGLAVLTVFQRSQILPPALFGTRVTKYGINRDQSLNPLDVVSPGTIKMYHGNIFNVSNISGNPTGPTQIPMSYSNPTIHDSNLTIPNGVSVTNYDQPLTKARALERIPENRALLRKSSNYTWHQLDGNTETEPRVSGTTRKSEQNETNHVPNIKAESRQLIPIAETYYNEYGSGGISTYKGFPGLNGTQPNNDFDTFINNEFITLGRFIRPTTGNAQNHNPVWKSTEQLAGRPQIVRITTGKQSKAVLSMEDASGVPFKTSGQTSETAFRPAINVSGREGDNSSYEVVRNFGVPETGGAGSAAGTGAAGTSGSISGNRMRRTGHGHGFRFQDNLSWDHLLQALSNNQRIDLLGDELKDLRDNLPNVISDGYLRIEGNVTANPHAAYNPRGALTGSPGVDTNSGVNTNSDAHTRNGASNTGHSWINHDLIVGTNGKAQGSLVVHGTRDNHIRGSLQIGQVGDQRNLVVNSHLRVNDTSGKERFYVNGTTGDTRITGASGSAFFRVRDDGGTDRMNVQSDNGRTQIGIGTGSITQNRLKVFGAADITGHTTVGTDGGVITSAAGYSTGSPTLTVSGLITGNTLNSILNYIIVGGIRLYVSHSNPGNPPVNSVGIGWT